MQEIVGNFWDVRSEVKVITTNGDINRLGKAVMGRGIAKQAADRYPELPTILARFLRSHGNHIIYLGRLDDTNFLSFPVKDHWNEKAKLSLIARSIQELLEAAEFMGAQGFLLPRPGCGNGGLLWSEVKPILEPRLDDRFTIINLT